MLKWTLGALAALGLAAAARAEEKINDELFIQKAASCNKFEIDSSNLALQRATNANVRKFAQMMVDDHMKCGEEFKALLQRKGVQPPEGLSEKARQKVADLSKLSGNDFDQKYWKYQIDAHEEAVKLFQQAATQVKDSDLRAFAEKTLPKLQEHQAHLRKMSVGGVGGRDR